jgi:hypothetical protein
MWDPGFLAIQGQLKARATARHHVYLPLPHAGHHDDVLSAVFRGLLRRPAYVPAHVRKKLSTTSELAVG